MTTRNSTDQHKFGQTRSRMTEHGFKAFISYSHSDNKIAVWLQKALEHYRLPKSLIGLRNTKDEILDRKIGHIFLDRSDMAAAPSLSESTRNALRRSDYLIVICSPESACSSYVKAEIDFFLELKRSNKILAVLTSGEPNSDDESLEALPPQFRSAQNHGLEPLAADIRPGGDGRKNTILKIIAGLLSVDLDDLIVRERKRNRRRATLFGTLGLAVLVVITTLTVYWKNEQHAAAQDLSRTLALQSLNETKAGNAQRALQLAIQALPQAIEGQDTPDTSEAHNALRAAVGSLTFAELEQHIGGHNGWIEEVGFLPEKDYFLSLGSADGTIRVWNSKNYILEKIRWAGTGISSLGAGMDVGSTGNIVAFVARGKKAVIWDVEADRLVREFEVTGDLSSVHLNADKSRVLTVERSGEVASWDWAQGTSLQTFEKNDVSARVRHGHKLVAFDPFDSIAFLRGSNYVWRWNYENGQTERLINKPALEWHVSIPHYSLLATASKNGQIDLWNSQSGDHVRELQSPVERLSALVVSSSGQHLLAGYESGSSIVWDLVSGGIYATLNGPTEYVSEAVLLSEDTAITGQGDGTIHIWDLKTESSLRSLKHTEAISSIDMSQDEQQLLAGDYSGTIKVWSIVDGSLLWSNGIDGEIKHVSISPDSELALVITSGNPSDKWLEYEPEVQYVTDTEIGNVTQLTSDGRLLLTVSEDKKNVVIRDLKEGTVISEHRGDTTVSRALVSDDGTISAIISSARTGTTSLVTIEKLSSSMAPREFNSPFEVSAYDNMSLSSNGKFLAFSGLQEIIIFNTEDGSYAEIPETDLIFRIIRVSPSGQLLVAGATDMENNTTVKLWKIGQENPVRVIKVPGLELTDLALSHNDERLLTGFKSPALSDVQAEVRVWDVATGFLYGQALVFDDVTETRFISGTSERFLVVSDKYAGVWGLAFPDTFPKLLKQAMKLQ